MKFWDIFDKVVTPVQQQTVSDDPHSRLARRDFEERNRIQRVEYDDDGNELLWFDVTFSVGDHSGIPIPWSGKSADDVIESFTEWLNEAEFHTINYVNNGAQRKLRFRTGFVAHFEVGTGRKRR